MRSVCFAASTALVAVLAAASPSRATVPGGIEITCDVPRTGSANFRSAAAGQSSVTFRLHSDPTANAQIGSDYVLATASLAVAKRYTDKFDSVASRKAMRINAVIGSDGSPVALPSNGVAWLEIAVGTQTFGCDFAATGNVTARRRLQSVAFSRESSHSETCDDCTTAGGLPDVSARVYRAVDQSIPDNVVTPVTFDTEKFDTDDLFDGGSPTRLMFTTAGKYLLTAWLEFETSFTTVGFREVTIRLNGSKRIAREVMVPSAAAPSITTLSAYWVMAAGDYVELTARQTSGGPLNVHASAGDPEEGATLSAVKLP